MNKIIYDAMVKNFAQLKSRKRIRAISKLHIVEVIAENEKWIQTLI